MKPLVSIIIVNWQSAAQLELLFASLVAQTYKNVEVIVVNNSPQEEIDVEVLRQANFLVEINTPSKNLGFCGGNNTGIGRAQGEFILLLNPDTKVSLSAIALLVDELLQHPESDVALPKILQLDHPTLLDRVWDGYARSGWAQPVGYQEQDSGQYDQRQPAFGFRGAAAMLRKSFFDEVGLFDEDLFAFYEDVDLSLRAQLMGKTMIFVPQAIVWHKGSGSTGNPYTATTIYLSARNKLWVFVKNMPTGLLLRNSWRHVLIQIAIAGKQILQTGQIWAHVRGIWAGLVGLRGAWSKRTRIQALRQISVAKLNQKMILCEQQGKLSRSRRVS